MSDSSWTQLPATKARLIEVIQVETCRGGPEPGNEPRTVFQYWSKEGELLAEWDTIFAAPDLAWADEPARVSAHTPTLVEDDGSRAAQVFDKS